MFVEGVDRHLGVAGDHLRLERQRLFARPAASFVLAGEDQLHAVGPAEVEVVGDQCLEEPAGVARGVEDQRARNLDLPHRQLPPVTSLPIVVGQRQRQHAHPALEEHVDRARSETVADRLQPVRVGAGGEPVGQFGEGQASVNALTLGPLVPVHPHLDRIREVGAHLDERRAELDVPQVEVEARHAPVGLGEREPRHPVAAPPLDGGEHVLILLRHPDRRHPGTAGRCLDSQVLTHQSILRSPLLNRTTGMCSDSANALTDRRHPVPIRSRIAGDGIGQPRC